MKKNKRKYIHHFYNDTFYMNVWYFKNYSWEEFKNYMLKNYSYKCRTEDEPRGITLPLNALNDETKESTQVLCIWLANKTDFSGLVHEALHIVITHLRNIGVKLSEDSEETYTYLLAWLIDKFTNIQK